MTRYIAIGIAEKRNEITASASTPTEAYEKFLGIYDMMPLLVLTLSEYERGKDRVGTAIYGKKKK